MVQRGLKEDIYDIKVFNKLMAEMKSKILNLINSIEFQELNSYYNEKTMFNALNVERKENRHSAFIAWWLNPKSEHGLGDVPLKLFLRLVAVKSQEEAIFGKTFYGRVLAGDYIITILEDIEVEKNVGKISNTRSKDRIDIWSVLELSCCSDDDAARVRIPIVIENKIYSKEGKVQTQKYYNVASSYPHEDVELRPMGVFLTVEPQKPSCGKFVNITYQDLLTYVIEPLVSTIAPNSIQFVEAFIRNLGRPALTDNKYYGVLAVSKKEREMLQRVVENNREIFDTAFVSIYNSAIVKKIVDEDVIMSYTTGGNEDILRMLWDANDVVFKAVIYHLYDKEEYKNELNKLFKSSNRDTGKYIVKHNGDEIFPNKRLSKAMTACAIFKAYLKEYPTTTLEELQKAFPCKEINDYYYDRFYNDLFYDYTSGQLPRTGGKNNGDMAQAQWDFYLKDNQLLPIDSGNKKAMCVKWWRKGDFDRLIEFVHKNGYGKFITIEEC